MESCQETNEEKDFQNTRVGEVDQYDEEVIEENIFGSEMSCPGLNEHPEVETNVFVPQEPNIKDVIKATSTNQLTSGESKLTSEMNILGMNEHPDVETNVFMSQEPDENDVIEAVSTNELPSCETILGSETRTPLVANFTKKDFTVFMLESDKLKKDNTYETIKGSNSEFDGFFNGRISTGRLQEEQISELEREHELNGCETEQSFSMVSFVSGCAKVILRMPNSSKKVFPANKQRSADNVNVKKTLVSRVPGSPQMLTPKTSKPLIPTVKSASRSFLYQMQRRRQYLYLQYGSPIKFPMSPGQQSIPQFPL